MFGPGWKEGCVGCSFKADHVDAAWQHFERHDAKFVAISRAPLVEIAALQQRMGWRFKWVFSHSNDFKYDYHVSYTNNEIAAGKVYCNYALSVFYKDAAGNVFHTYSTHGRGDEMLVGAYMYLDLTPEGRNETGPHHNLGDWVRHHDRYDAGGTVNHQGRYIAAAQADSSCGCGKHHY